MPIAMTLREPRLLARWRLLCAALLALLGGTVSARTVDEVDLSGYWEPVLMEDFQSTYVGPDPADFAGLPINAEARSRALSYSDGLLAMPERQCMYYGPTYLVIGPFGFRLSAESDPQSGNTIAWRIAPWIDRPAMSIWMDGRDHPGSEVMHTVAGFTTGQWQGHTLTTYTTHVRESLLRRNGVPSSDRATMIMHFTRHGEYLQITALITDPIYLSEPYVLSRLYRQNPQAYLKNDMTIPCVPRRQGSVAPGAVPHYLPGQNPQQDQFAMQYGVPLEAALGGAETMYPEYRQRLTTSYQRPAGMCTGFCCGWGDARNPDHYNRYAPLQCPGRKRTSPEVVDLVNEAAPQ